jgi:hypothetical protein
MSARAALFASLLALGCATAARAQPIQVNNAGLEISETRYLLNADFHLVLGGPLLEALNNGVSLGFLVEFELTRPRWYWFDEKTVSEKLELRLSYLTLAQQYRLSSGTLYQNFQTLGEALAALGRVHWLGGAGPGSGGQRAKVHRLGSTSAQSGAAAGSVPREQRDQPRMDARFRVEALPVRSARTRAGGAMTYVLIASAALGGILLFLLAAATANSPLFAEHYPLLLGLNAAIALALLGLVAFQLSKLARQRRAKVFGSLLTFRVLVMFALVGIVPGLLVYTVSLQFLAKSIESWFDVRVERALEGGLNLGRAALDVMLNELLLKGHVMALDLSEAPRREQPALLARLRDQAYVEEAVLIAADGEVLSKVHRRTGPVAGRQALRDVGRSRLRCREASSATRGCCSGHHFARAPGRSRASCG